MFNDIYFIFTIDKIIVKPKNDKGAGCGQRYKPGFYM